MTAATAGGVLAIMILALAAAGCATSAPKTDITTEARIERALSEISGACGASFAETTRAFRKVYGLPACRENRLSKTAYREDFAWDAAGALGFRGGDKWCAASIGARRKDFDRSLSAVMAREGFMEADAFYILVCHFAYCNGDRYCSGARYRDFYRASDGLRIIAYFGTRDYPNAHSLITDANAEDHACADVQRAHHCYPPSERRD